MVEVASPLAITVEVPVMLEFAATATSAVKMTFPSALTTGVSIERVLVSALRELKVHVDTPNESVTEHRLNSFVVPVSVAENVGVCPDTGLLKASFKVMVTVEVATPSATIGVVPVIVELAATALLGVNVTSLPVTATGEVNWRVFTSAVVEARVQRESPLAFETEHIP